MQVKYRAIINTHILGSGKRETHKRKREGTTENSECRVQWAKEILLSRWEERSAITNEI